MTTLREAAQQALEALSQFEYRSEGCIRPDFVDVACAALRAALAEQPAEQEPVAWARYPRFTGSLQRQEVVFKNPDSKSWVPLYTAPQPAKREPLTDEEIWDAVWHCDDNRFAVARAIEAAHGIGELK